MELKIQKLSIQGDGIAEGPIYIPFTLPDEVVEGEITGNRIERAVIISPSPSRTAPPCTHFGVCGGCAMQHASDDFVADWKADIIRTALAAHGLSAHIRPTITSPAQSRRRAKFTGRRTKKTIVIGFHGRASETVMAVPNCRLLHPGIMASFPAMEALTKIGASRKGSVSIAITWSDNGADVAVENAKEVDGPLLAELGNLAENFKLARLTWNGETVVTRARPSHAFGTASVTPPPNAFLQATAAGHEALVATVTEAVGDAKNIVDLFSGCGTFTLPLAKNAQVVAIEGDQSLLSALDAAWRLAKGLKTVETRKRDLFRNPLLAEELPFDAVIIDPPRAGAKAQCEAIAESSVPRIAFVSCNSVTFASDVKILTDAGYKIEWVQPIDQFRWSAHVELVALLTRNSSSV